MASSSTIQFQQTNTAPASHNINPITSSDSDSIDIFENYEGFVHEFKDRKQITVCVTGASGFLGSHCVNELLWKGYNVSGTVRGEPHSDKYLWLYTLGPKTNKVKLYQADLLTPHSFDTAFADCDYIFHVASPVSLKTIDHKSFESDMYLPAVKGTLNVLNSCLKHVHCEQSKLKRIILTSSLYAIYGIPKTDKLYIESDWNDDFTLNMHPYAYSKTEAERAAWKFMKDHKDEIKDAFDLISICPPLIIGAQLQNGSRLTSSNVIIYNVVKGRFGRTNCGLPIADVRDIAALHVFFIENEKGMEGQGRYCCWGTSVIGGDLIDGIERYCIERGVLSPIPCCISCCRCDMFCCGCLFKSCSTCCCVPRRYQQYFTRNVNKGRKIVSDAKIKGLGFKFRDFTETLNYTLDYFANEHIVL
eukprot:113585_1